MKPPIVRLLRSTVLHHPHNNEVIIPPPQFLSYATSLPFGTWLFSTTEPSRAPEKIICKLHVKKKAQIWRLLAPHTVQVAPEVRHTGNTVLTCGGKVINIHKCSHNVTQIYRRNPLLGSKVKSTDRERRTAVSCISLRFGRARICIGGVE